MALWVDEFPHGVDHWLRGLVDLVSGGTSSSSIGDAISNILLPSVLRLKALEVQVLQHRHWHGEIKTN